MVFSRNIRGLALPSRKDETDEQALFGVVRTLEEVRRLRSEGNQPGKRDFELAIGLVAVLEQAVYFLMPLGDLLVFSVIDVPGNPPIPRGPMAPGR